MDVVRGRGKDFTGNLRMSRWAEDLSISAFDSTSYIAVHFGASSSTHAPYVEVDLNTKEPDLLVFRRADLLPEELKFLERMNEITEENDNSELMTCNRSDFEEGKNLHWVLNKAVCAIEVDQSASNSKAFRERDCEPKPWEIKKRQGPKNLPNPPSAPNVWIKIEDIPRLCAWQENHGVRIVILHLFNYEAFGVTLSDVHSASQRIESFAKSSRPRAYRYMRESGFFLKEHNYANNLAQGSSMNKQGILVAPYASTKAADIRDVAVKSEVFEQHAKYAAKVIFEGGSVKFTPEFMRLIDPIGS